MSTSTTFNYIGRPSEHPEFGTQVDLMALTFSHLGSRVRGTRDVRGSYRQAPHLLVVSARDSFDTGPARPDKRPSGGAAVAAARSEDRSRRSNRHKRL
jgi:hypothetical protein